MRRPSQHDESWPMVLAVVVALFIGLIAALQLGGVTIAANAAAYVPLPAAVEILPLDYGCGNARLAETWLMVAHPSLVPTFW